MTLHVIVIYVLATTGLEVWKQYNLNRDSYREYQKRAGADRKEAAEKIARECSVVIPASPVFANCLAEKMEAYEKQAATEKDLQAQQDMAYWAFLLFILTVFTTIVSVIGLVLLYLSLRQTRTAIKDNREIGEAEVRAYIGVQDFDDSPYYNLPDIEADKSFEINFSHKNTGNTPAHKVRYVALCEIRDHPLVDDRERLIAPHPDQPIPINTIQAGEISRMEAHSDGVFSKEDIASAMKGNEKRIYLIGMIEYEDVFQRYQYTDFCYYLDTVTVINRNLGRLTKASWIRSVRHNSAS